MADSPHIEVLDDLLKTAERDFEATVTHSALIDDKAQKTSALAGLFLAAAFGFIKPESLTALREQYGSLALLLLYGALACFVATLVLCLRAMWLKDVPTSGVSLESQEMSAEFLLDLTEQELDADMMAAYKRNQVEIWKSAIAERFTANVAKTNLVHRAQQALIAGIFVSAVSLGLLGYAAGMRYH